MQAASQTSENYNAFRANEGGMAKLSRETRMHRMILDLLEKETNIAPYGATTRVAKALGVTTAYASELIHKRRVPGTKVIEALMRIYGKTYNEIVGLDDDSPEDVSEPDKPASLGSHRDWPKVSSLVAAKHRWVTKSVLTEVASATFASGPPEYLSESFVLQLCQAIDSARREQPADNDDGQ